MQVCSYDRSGLGFSDRAYQVYGQLNLHASMYMYLYLYAEH